MKDFTSQKGRKETKRKVTRIIAGEEVGASKGDERKVKG